MKHAWLIIAHEEFEILKLLVSELDHPDNDIFVHIDKKVKKIPDIQTKTSRLHILDERLDVRWGHFSQIETEILLFKTASWYGPYSYYHLISGVHLTLKPLSAIFSYFKQIEGNTVFSDLVQDSLYQETLKVHRYNLFLRNYASSSQVISRISQFLWKSIIAVQRVLGITRNEGISFYKARNWVSLTEEALQYIISQEKQIRHIYRFSFCGDEFFVPSILMASSLKDKTINSDCFLLCNMLRANAQCFRLSERSKLVETKYLFARKFTLDSDYNK